MDEHPHRWFEYAPSERGHCSGKCKELIEQGQLRYGTKLHIQDHDSISYRCLACITHRQAENICSVASDQGLSVHKFLTVPPSDANGPSERVVAMFIEYLEALHLENQEVAEKLLAQLDQERKPEEEVKGKGNKKATSNKKKRDSNVDLHELDAQIRDDQKMLKLFTVADLKSLCVHHDLATSGTKPSLQGRLEKFYDELESSPASVKKAKQ